MRTINVTPKQHVKATSIVLLILASVVLLAIATSCESESGKLAKRPFEKAVIIDSSVKMEGKIQYKVKRLSTSTVQWITLYHPYEKGDTIMYQFQNY